MVLNWLRSHLWFEHYVGGLRLCLYIYWNYIKPLYTVYSVRLDTYFQVNWVEHQKPNQTTAELSFGWVFGVQLELEDYRN